MRSVLECRRCFEKTSAETRHLFDELAGQSVGFRFARESLDVVGERANDRSLGSKVHQPQLRGKSTVSVGFESRERRDVRSHVSTYGSRRQHWLLTQLSVRH